MNAQTGIKQLNANKTIETITIDGVLDEAIWQTASVASEFIQYEPYNGKPSKYQSKVRILYNNYAIYIGAELIDEAPDSIMKQLSKRDEIGQSDFFGLTIDPFNDKLTGFTFIVTPANVQFDARVSKWDDTSWDAVWVSKTNITSNGWVVEMEIPYSELRFPKKDIQEWGLNLIRNVQRTRERSYWNHFDNSVDGYLKQAGILTGIMNIDPPIRLSVTPYLSGYVINSPESNSTGYELRGGMDLKYGLNESYTLDMMLIPDFGQVESDDKVLNISAFETYYDEKRPFFMEGTELFDKGEIFYSRRIGSIKSENYDAEFNLNEHEELSAPAETSLINVTKISGKGKNGLGIGLLNGVSTNADVTIKDTSSGSKRKELLQPITNYNVLVFDQSLKNNSFISLTNTNYLQPEFNYASNVTASHMRFENKQGTYALEAIIGTSYINDTDNSDSTGYKYNIEFQKIKGNFRFGFEQALATKKYNQNDMGFLPKTDELGTEIGVGYNFYEPIGYMLKWYNWLEYDHFSLFSNNKYVGSQISIHSFTTLKNYLSISLNMETKPNEFHDYYEPRVAGRFISYPAYAGISTYISPDYRKKFVLDTEVGWYQSFKDDMRFYHASLMPIIRISDKLNIRLSTRLENFKNQWGYIDHTSNEDSIFIGRRTANTFINSANINYNFNADMSLSFRSRHYWTTIKYKQYYLLNSNGSLNDKLDNYYTDNINSNFFNIDLVYRWHFAPGSELSLVWKNAIASEDNNANMSYYSNFSDLFDLSAQNSFSIRILYYIDYFKTTQRIKQKNSVKTN